MIHHLHDRLQVLSNEIVLDGRVAWFADHTRGFAPINTYALIEPDEILLVDTGVAAHADQLVAQIQQCRAIDDQPVSVFHTRLGEYNSVGNTAVVIDTFPTARVFGAHNSTRLWVEFRPLADRKYPDRPTPLNDVETVVVHGTTDFTVGQTGARKVRALPAPLKLLPAHWLWDELTGTLMTSDAFTHVWRDRDDDSWVITADNDTMTIDEVRTQLLTKFAWLADADTGPTLAGLEAVFDAYPIRTIAPSYGCVLQGRSVVQRHYDMIRTILSDLKAR